MKIYPGMSPDYEKISGRFAFYTPVPASHCHCAACRGRGRVRRRLPCPLRPVGRPDGCRYRAYFVCKKRGGTASYGQHHQDHDPDFGVGECESGRYCYDLGLCRIYAGRAASSAGGGALSLGRSSLFYDAGVA